MSINIDRIIFRPAITDFSYLRELREQLIDIDTLKKKEGVHELAIDGKVELSDLVIILSKILFTPRYHYLILS